MIKTTLQKALVAFRAIGGLGKKVTGHDALQVFRLKNALKEPLCFMTEEEEKLVGQFGGSINDGAIMIHDSEQRSKFIKAHRELENMEYEVNAEPVVISMESNKDITLEEIEQLDGFVNFE